MMNTEIQPGDRVIIGDDITGIVERVIYGRGMIRPLLLVEWWCDGDVRAREFDIEDVRRAE